MQSYAATKDNNLNKNTEHHKITDSQKLALLKCLYRNDHITYYLLYTPVA